LSRQQQTISLLPGAGLAASEMNRAAAALVGTEPALALLAVVAVQKQQLR
jgi:hypothetical protein